MNNLFKTFFFIITFVSFSRNVFGQQDSLRLKKSIIINYDNDFFVATDYYYTQGIHIETFLPAFQKNPIAKILVKLPHGENEGFGISANQQCYTPTSIRHSYISVGDRPYTGSLFVGFSHYSLNEKKQLRLVSNLDLGIMGPNGYGHEIQRGIHRWTHSQTPEGWEYQLSNTPVINYSTEIEKGLLNKKHFDAETFSVLRFGSYFNDICGGLNARIGLKNNYFEREHSQNKFHCWIFGRGEIKFVGYNTTMQGGFFTSNVYVVPTKNISRTVFGASTGIVLAYKKLQIEYAEYFISPEYKNGWAHAWGHCDVDIIF